MLTIRLALLLQLNLITSESHWHQLSPQEQQALQEYVGDVDINL